MPRRHEPLPSSFPDVFRCADAEKLGIDGSRLRAVDLERPFHGVRRVLRPAAEADEVTADRDDPLARDHAARRTILRRIEAHALVLPTHAFYVGAAGRAILDLALTNPEAAATAHLEVAVSAPHRALRMKGVRSIQVAPGLAYAREHEGYRVASPASLWALEGRTSSVAQLVALGDAIVRIPRDDRGRRRPEAQLATIDHLRGAAAAGRRRGVDKLREALELIRVGSMSVLETDARLALVSCGLPEPELDVEVRDRAGRLLGISDGAYVAQRVAIEVEGDHHRKSRSQWNRDIEKYAAYAAIGWEVVRLTAAHVRGPRPTAPAIVGTVLARRGFLASS